MTATSVGSELLALDFDGVVCDALEECALVTWLGVHDADPGLRGPELLAAVPRSFVETFAIVRNYSRLLEHFLVAHLPGAVQVTSQRQFDALIATVPPERVQEFQARATQARERLRETELEFWLDLHTLYPGVADLIRRYAGAVVIVTAKDADSVWAVLRRNGLDGTVAEIHGDCSRKAEVVQDVAVRRGVPTSRVTFIDDNLTNALRVASTGARARWAQWGYQTPEHREQAVGSGLEPLHLGELDTLVPAGA